MIKLVAIIFFTSKFLFVYSYNEENIHKKIIDQVLSHEGEKILITKNEYSKYGIKNLILKKYNSKYKTNFKVKTLKKEQATLVGLYLIKKYRINEVYNCYLKLVIFDLFYNAGPGTGALITQKSLNKYHSNKIFLVAEDKIMAGNTINSLNNVKNVDLFVKIFTEERLQHYSKLKNWNIYKNGWEKRIKSFLKHDSSECKINKQ